MNYTNYLKQLANGHTKSDTLQIGRAVVDVVVFDIQVNFFVSGQQQLGQNE